MGIEVSKAPERFYMCNEGQLYEDLADVDTVETYVRADLHADLLRAADELAEAASEDLKAWPSTLVEGSALSIAITAYQQAKEKI